MTNAQVDVAKDNQGFDIDSLDAVTVVTHRCAVISDEEGNPVSGFIMVGKNSEEYVANARQNRVDNIQRAGMRKKALDTATTAGATVVADTVARNDRTTALAVVVGWFGFNKGSQPATFNKATVEQMFERAPQWQAKVLADLEAEANFMPASSKA